MKQKSSWSKWINPAKQGVWDIKSPFLSFFIPCVPNLLLYFQHFQLRLKFQKYFSDILQDLRIFLKCRKGGAPGLPDFSEPVKDFMFSSKVGKYGPIKEQTSINIHSDMENDLFNTIMLHIKMFVIKLGTFLHPQLACFSSLVVYNYCTSWMKLIPGQIRFWWIGRNELNSTYFQNCRINRLEIWP